MRRYRIIEEEREDGSKYYIAQRRCKFLPIWKSYYEAADIYESTGWHLFVEDKYSDIEKARSIIRHQKECDIRNRVVKRKVIEKYE